MNKTTSKYQKSFNTYSGADITVTFDNVVIGELQAITYSVTREKGPVYVMGDPNPKSFSRGKRGIAGSLVFSIFDRDALDELKNLSKVHRNGLNTSGDLSAGGNGEVRTAQEQASFVGATGLVEMWQKKVRPNYIDEIPPFDITINFLNEAGHASRMEIYGVEILNEGMGMSIDDLTSEKACTFIARSINEMTAMDDWES